jgi:hypothetical protein
MQHYFILNKLIFSWSSLLCEMEGGNKTQMVSFYISQPLFPRTNMQKKGSVVLDLGVTV